MPSQPIPASDSITSDISDLNNASMFTDRSSPEDASFSSSLQGVRSFMDTHALQLRGDCHHIQRLRHNNMINYLRLREQNAVLSVLRKAIASKLQSLKAQRKQQQQQDEHYDHHHNPSLSDSSIPTSSAMSFNMSSPTTSPGSSPTSTVTDDQFTASFPRFSSMRPTNAFAAGRPSNVSYSSSHNTSRGGRLVQSATSNFLKPRTSFERCTRMQCFNFGSSRISRSSDDGTTSPSHHTGDRPVDSTQHLLELYIEAIDNVQTSFNKVRWAKLRDDVIRKSTLPVVTSRLDHATPGKGLVAFSDRLLHAARLDDMIQRCMAKQEYLLNEAEDKLTSSVLGVRLYKNRGSHH